MVGLGQEVVLLSSDIWVHIGSWFPSTAGVDCHTSVVLRRSLTSHAGWNGPANPIARTVDWEGVSSREGGVLLYPCCVRNNV